MLAGQTDIFRCQSYREFLARVTHRKAKPKLRIKDLSRLAGFQSAAAMTMILKGSRNLGVESAERLAEKLPLSSHGQNYFINLVRLEGVINPEEERHLQEEQLFLRSRREEHVMELRQFRFLSIWYYPVIYALASRNSLSNDSEQIAQVLGRGVTARMVKVAVGDLLNLNLLRLKNGHLQQTTGGLTTGEDIKHAAIYRYHHAMMDRAKEALELPLDEREMNGLTVLVPKNKMSEVKQRIRKFRKELSEFLMDATTGEVHQINIQFFPLTKTPTSGVAK